MPTLCKIDKSRGGSIYFPKMELKKLKNELKYTKKGSKKRWIAKNIDYINALWLQVLQLNQVEEARSALG